MRSDIEDDEIESLPRRERTKKKPSAKMRKSFAQAKCNHQSCINFKDKFNHQQLTFSQWKKSVTQSLKSKNHKDQLNFLSLMITFVQPKKSKDRKKWINNDRDFRYAFPKCYDLELPNPCGIGKTKVCAQYFRYIFSFGKAKFHSIMASIWESRRCGGVEIQSQQNYKGYRGSGEESDWINRFEQFAVNHRHLSRSHYTADKEVVYFDLESGKKQDWHSLWKDFIKHDQPVSYDNHLKPKKKHERDDSVPKPKPQYRRFVKVIPKLFKCKPMRKDVDKCNGCQQLKILNDQDVSLEEKQRLNRLHKAHLRRAALCYQLNSHYKKFAIQSFKSRSITVRRLKKAEMEHNELTFIMRLIMIIQNASSI